MVPISDMDGTSVSDRSSRGKRDLPISREDCLCPVCLEIYIEPVTLPCTHTFCKTCFLESVDKATLCCPMCRKRVSTWARLNSRNKTLVNEHLWKQIQANFPLQCQRRVSGQDAVDEDLAVFFPFPKVCEPGELRQEYEDQITKFEQEKRVLDEEERRASEQYIQQLLAEEEELLVEETKRREEDERLARLISHQLNSESVSQEGGRSLNITPAKKNERANPGQIEKFLCPIGPRATCSDIKPSSSFIGNKENIVLSPLRLNPSSAGTVQCPSTQLDSTGTRTCKQEQTETSNHATSLQPTSNEDSDYMRSISQRDTCSSVKRKSSELDITIEKEEEIQSKRSFSTSTVASISDVPSLSEHLQKSGEPTESSSGLRLQQEMAEWEAELLSRRQQEDEDRRVALLLQKELDWEDQCHASDRSKGSTNAYLLREKRKQETESNTETPVKPSTSASKTPKRRSSSSSAKRPTPRTSSPSPSIIPSTSLSRGKQTTLTDLFSSPGS